MSNNLPIDEPKFVDVNNKILSFKHPSIFNQQIADKILLVFRNNAVVGNNYLTLKDLSKAYDDLQTHREKKRDSEYKRYLSTINWQKKNQDELDINAKIRDEKSKDLKEHLHIFSSEGIIKSVYIIVHADDALQELKKYFLVQTTQDLFSHAKEDARIVLDKYILQKQQECLYPFRYLLHKTEILQHIQDRYFEVNQLLYEQIRSSQLLEISLSQVQDGKEVFKNFLFPGKSFSSEATQYLQHHLIPTLKECYAHLKQYLTEVSNQFEAVIDPNEITVDYPHSVHLLCFMILEAKKKGTGISVADYNLATIILNFWLAMEDDPLYALRAFPNIELGNDFLSPFLTRYIQDFSHISKYLSSIKGFMDHLPMVIEDNDLLIFFKQEGVQKQVVEEFLAHLPENILSINMEKHHYIVGKGQIVSALSYLYHGNFHKSTESGHEQFEALAIAFHETEQNHKDFNQLILDLKTTSDQYKQTKDILLKSDVYRSSRKKNKAEAVLSTNSSTPQKKSMFESPSKKIYTQKDFENLTNEDREMLFKALNLMIVECVDSQKNHHQLFIKKGELTLDDARFFRGKPTYELIRRRFNL